MIKENTTIARIESDCLWVSGIQRSSCGSCTAKTGCGQHLLAGVLLNAPLIRIPLTDKELADYSIGQQVEISIPEDVVVKGALFIYFCPLLCLMFAIGFADSMLSSELAIVGSGAVGLIIGGLAVRIASAMQINNGRLQPGIVRSDQSLVL